MIISIMFTALFQSCAGVIYVMQNSGIAVSRRYNRTRFYTVADYQRRLFRRIKLSEFPCLNRLISQVNGGNLNTDSYRLSLPDIHIFCIR